MKISYDPDADAMYIELVEREVAKTKEVDDNTIIDLDNEGNVIGVEILFVKERILFWFFSLSVLFIGPVFLMYASYILANDFVFGIWERFLIVIYFLAAFFIAYGLKCAIDLCAVLAKRVGFDRKDFVTVLVAGILFLFPMYLFLVNKPKSDLAHFNLGDQFGHDILASSSPSSVVLVFSDTVSFNSQYVYYTSDEFRDRNLIIGSLLRRSYYRNQVIRQYPSLQYSDYFRDGGSDDAWRYVVDLTEKNPNVDFFSFNFTPKVENKKWDMSGLLFKLVDEGYENKDPESVIGKFAFKAKESEYRQFIHDHMYESYYEMYLRLGNYFYEKKDLEKALNYFDNGVALLPLKSGAYLGKGSVLKDMSSCQAAEDVLKQALGYEPKNVRIVDALIEIAKNCFRSDSKLAQYQEIKVKIENKSTLF